MQQLYERCNVHAGYMMTRTMWSARVLRYIRDDSERVLPI